MILSCFFYDSKLFSFSYHSIFIAEKELQKFKNMICDNYLKIREKVTLV